MATELQRGGDQGGRYENLNENPLDGASFGLYVDVRVGFKLSVRGLSQAKAVLRAGGHCALGELGAFCALKQRKGASGQDVE